MLAEKVFEKEKSDRPIVHGLRHIVKKISYLKADDLLEMLTNAMFKIILLLGIPYFIFVFIKFLLIS